MGNNSLIRDMGKVKRIIKDNNMSEYAQKLQEYLIVDMYRETQIKQYDKNDFCKEE